MHTRFAHAYYHFKSPSYAPAHAHTISVCFCPLFTSDINDDFFDVKSALTPVAANWKDIGIALRLKHNVLDIIQAKNRGDPTACLASVVEEWLKRNYSDKFGEPTWQWLVKVVGDPAGGGNKALAKDIAREHKAKGTEVIMLRSY